MITPLGQRQMFQTVNAEAVRAALEVGGHFQREAAQKQALAERMAEDSASVPEIPPAEGMKTEERRGGRKQQEHAQRRQGEGVAAAPSEGLEDGANPAETHMDFLA